MTAHPPETRPPVRDPLDQASIGALISGQMGAPFDVLGPHRVEINGEPVWIVRAFVPHAEGVDVALQPGASVKSRRSASTGEQSPGQDITIPMQRLHPDGLFSAILPGKAGSEPPRYTLLIHWPLGVNERRDDTYSFPPQLSDFDLHLMGEGKHYDLYEKMGAHPTQVNGVPGVRFAVWAPNARRVSVVGDFNGWDERANPMRLRPGGVWELFVPGLASGALYKYAILSWNGGAHLLKADPYAFWAEVRPGTASRVYDLSGYQWHDADWITHRPEHNGVDQPVLVYEMHVGSWRPSSSPGGDHGPVSYRDLAHQLVPYVKEMGYTHIELLPIAEHPWTPRGAIR